MPFVDDSGVPYVLAGSAMKFFVVRVWCVLVLVMGSGLCIPAFRVQGQTPAPATPAKASPAGDFSKEAVVLEKVSTRVREEADGTGSHETSMRVRIQSEAGVKQMAVLLFTYTASNQQAEIGYVRVIKPDGTVVATPDYNVQDLPADVSREAPMYSDIHQKHVAVKGLGVGDTLEYKVTLRTVKPEVPGQFWLEYSFEKNLIVLDEQFDLDLPEGKAATVASPDVQPATTHAQGRVLYHWASSNLTRPDPDKPKSTKHWKPSVQVTTFTGWDQVGAWYWSLQKDEMTVTPAIQARAAALTKGLTTDDEKMRAIFSAVALHTHYIGISFGIGRYQPHAADDVLSNEYGDCKDKHTLLSTLLRAAGIEAWPVLISSSRELDATVPSPAQFDHVITVVPKDGKLIWMDATEEVAPIGVLMLPLRDKQALAIPASKPAYLERTPEALPFPQSFLFTANGKLSDKGEFTGHIEETFRGDSELVMRALFRQVPQSQWKQFVQQMIGNMGFGGETGQPEVSPVEQTTEPFHFSFDYTRQKFSEWEDRRINPPMPGVGWELAPGTREIKPADDIELGSAGEQDYKTSVQMTPGWLVTTPAGIDLKEDWAEYHSSYSFANGTFTAERKLMTKKDKVPLADWDKYRAFREAIYTDTVKMAGVSGPGNTSTMLPKMTIGGVVYDLPGLEYRQHLVSELQPVRDAMATLAATPPASEADRMRATEQCRTQALALEVESNETAAENPKMLYFAQALGTAWTCLGWGALETRQQGVAEIYLRPAWQLTQDPLPGYELARLLEAKGDKAGAVHLYELADVAASSGVVNGLPNMDLRKRIAESYQKLTGKELKVTPLNNGRYDGSLMQELNNANQIHKLIAATKLSGQALYSMAYEGGKPAKATFLSGDKSMNTLNSTLEHARFPTSLPKDSKARLVREVSIVCSPYAGCDAEMLPAGKIRMPSMPVKVIESNNLPKGAKQVQIEVEAPPKPN
jgi:hypothetical protein